MRLNGLWDNAERNDVRRPSEEWTPSLHCRECGRPREPGYPYLCPHCLEAWRERLAKEREAR